MPGAGLTLTQRLRTLLGAQAIVDSDGELPRVAPRSEDGCALLLRTATQHGWRVRIAGAGSWMPGDAPADLCLSTQALAKVRDVSGADLVATAEAGVRWNDLRSALAGHGAWLAVDPPGGDRTLGSVVATGTSGPLRSGFGPVRDHLLGLTLITGDGRIVRAGGRVVKNVAGYDLTKLATGSFGGFGVIAAVHLRLRAVPRADVTLAATATRGTVWQTARAIFAAGEPAAALELLAPDVTAADNWTLIVRLIGSDAGVESRRRAVLGVAQAGFREHTGPAMGLPAFAGGAPVTFRLGTPPAAIATATDLLAHHLDGGAISISVAAGALRWSGTVSPERLRILRHAAAQMEMPLTIERAPWPLRDALGHFGAYREGVGRIVGSIRRTFDPAGILVTAAGNE